MEAEASFKEACREEEEEEEEDGRRGAARSGAKHGEVATGERIGQDRSREGCFFALRFAIPGYPPRAV